MSDPQPNGDCQVCPNCGLALAGDGKAESGRFEYEPRYGVLYDGYRLPISTSRHLLMGSLMLAKGRVISVDGLLGVIGSEDVENGLNLIAVHVCNIRRACAVLEIPCPVETVTKRGYRWDADGDHRPPRLARSARLAEPLPPSQGREGEL